MLDRQFTYEDICTILVDQMAVDPEDLKGDPGVTFEDLGLDSLAGAELQVALQMTFGVEIPDNCAHELTSVQDTLDYLNQFTASSNVGSS